MIFVTKTYLPDINKYNNYVIKIFESGWLTNNSKYVKELSSRLSDYLGVEYVLPVANGTLGLQLAFKLLDLKGEIITTPFTFIATVSSIIWEGLTPVMADIDKRSLTIDPKEIEKKITGKTRAIVPVHVYGNTCDIEAIEDIARKHNLSVIYDAAHSFGVTYKGKGIASFGDISVFSFHSTKLFHTIEGGALTFNDKDLYEKARKMINFGITGPEKIESLGINAKMNEFEAAMGLCILDDIGDIIEERQLIYNKYMEEFEGNDELSFPLMNPDGTNNYSYFPVVLKTEKTMLRVKNALEDHDIYTRRYFYPSLDTVFETPGGIPQNSNEIASRVLCLPIYNGLEIKDVVRITEIVNKSVVL